MKVHHLPGAKYSPKVLLHQVLEEVDELEGIMVIKNYKDGPVTVTWTNMKAETASFMVHRLNLEFYYEIFSVSSDHDQGTPD